MIPVSAIGDAVPPTAPRMAIAPISTGLASICTASDTANITVTDCTLIAPGPAAERIKLTR